MSARPHCCFAASPEPPAHQPGAKIWPSRGGRLIPPPNLIFATWCISPTPLTIARVCGSMMGIMKTGLWMVEGFTDASELLRGGVYLLLKHGRVVFVGKSSKPMLPIIATLRSKDRPKFLQRIDFDQVLIRWVHPDSLIQTYQALIAEHQPKHNLEPVAIPHQLFERRI